MHKPLTETEILKEHDRLTVLYRAKLEQLNAAIHERLDAERSFLLAQGKERRCRDEFDPVAEQWRAWNREHRETIYGKK